MNVAQYVANGLASGAIYALVALGFVLVYKATGILNFAQGGFMLLGTYLAIAALVDLDVPFALTVVLIPVFMAMVGAAVHLTIMRKLIGQQFFTLVLVTIGIDIVIRAVILVWFGSSPRGRVSSLTGGQVEFADVVIPYVNIAVLASALLAFVAFFVVFDRTRFGLHMRSVADNLEAASAMGVDAQAVYAATWAITAALAGVAGVLYTNFSPTIEIGVSAIGLRAFPAAILGGLDSVSGALVGGLTIGVIEALGTGYFGAEYRDVVAFGLTFLVILWRPSGILGSKRLVRV